MFTENKADETFHVSYCDRPRSFEDRCGLLWVVVDRCGIVVGRCGSLWAIVDRCGSFRVLVTTSLLHSIGHRKSNCTEQ